KTLSRTGVAVGTLPVIALFAALLALSCGKGKDAGTIHLNGRLESPLVDLAPKVSGRVLEVRVREGDRVKSGDVLLRLDLGETAIAVQRDRAGLASAEAKLQDLAAGSRSAEIEAAHADVRDRRAALDLAAKERDRQKALLEQQIATRQDYDRAFADYARAPAA